MVSGRSVDGVDRRVRRPLWPRCSSQPFAATGTPRGKAHIFHSLAEMQERVQRLNAILLGGPLSSTGKTAASTVGNRAALEPFGWNKCIDTGKRNVGNGTPARPTVTRRARRRPA